MGNDFGSPPGRRVEPAPPGPRAEWTILAPPPVRSWSSCRHHIIHARGRGRVMDNLLWFLLIGLVAGWLAGQILKGSGFGLVGDLIIGCVGALVGGFLFGLLRVSLVGGLIDALLFATLGAIILLLLLRYVRTARW